MQNLIFKGVPTKINHIRFYFNQIDKLKRALNAEQMGRLFFAAANYAMTGVKDDVEPDILYPFNECIHNIDKAKSKY